MVKNVLAVEVFLLKAIFTLTNKFWIQTNPRLLITYITNNMHIEFILLCELCIYTPSFLFQEVNYRIDETRSVRWSYTFLSRCQCSKVMREGSESENQSLQPRASKWTGNAQKRNDVITCVDINKNHYPTEIPI